MATCRAPALAPDAVRTAGRATIVLRAAPRPSMRLLLARAEHGSVEEAVAIAASRRSRTGVVEAIVRRTEPKPMRAGRQCSGDARTAPWSGARPARASTTRLRAPARAASSGWKWRRCSHRRRDARRRIMIEAQDCFDRAGRGAGRFEGVRDKALAAARAGNARLRDTDRPAASQQPQRHRPHGRGSAASRWRCFCGARAEVAQALDAIGMLRPALDIEDRPAPCWRC